MVRNKFKKISPKFQVSSQLQPVQNEIRYIIVTDTERRDRGECRIGFPTLNFQNPEEGGNKPPKRRFINKQIV